MVLYHGSERRIPAPVFGAGNPRNDYGLGFYCTESVELAKEWACQRNADGFANRYDFDDAGLNVLDLSQPPYTLLHWLSILMRNRVFSPKSPVGQRNLQFLEERRHVDAEAFDVIRGYRANDSYFSFASDFLENAIPVQSLATSMRLGSLGLQVVLKSRKAFSRLVFAGAEPAAASEYGAKYMARDTAARAAYRERLRNLKPDEAVYLIDIVRNPELLDALAL